MKVLFYMNLSPRWLKTMGAAGVEVAHWSEVGAGNASDQEIMAYAKANDYTVLTHDLDFAAILAATHGNKPSVVQMRGEQLDPDLVGGFVLSALKQLAPQLAEGALVTIEPGRTRMRLLPLRKESL